MRLTADRSRVMACAAGALTLFLSAGCSTGDPDAVGSAAATPAAAASPAGLTAFELTHGIGPVTSAVTVASAPDKAMVAAGSKVFEQKCAACHKMSERYVGPALGDVTKRRSAAFVMNMMLNPQGMVEKHPETKKLLGEFFVPMPNQNLTPDEARQVLEFLRVQLP